MIAALIDNALIVACLSNGIDVFIDSIKLLKAEHIRSFLFNKIVNKIPFSYLAIGKPTYIVAHERKICPVILFPIKGNGHFYEGVAQNQEDQGYEHSDRAFEK